MNTTPLIHPRRVKQPAVRDCWKWLHFTPAEVECRCGCAGLPEEYLLAKLETIRALVKRPLIISSAYRCAQHNAAISTTGASGPHTTGLAVDILASGALAADVVYSALLLGAMGIGVHQKGPIAQRFVHVDWCERAARVLWSY